MIDFKALSKITKKADLKTELDKYTDQYPGLATIDPEAQTRAAMLTAARAAVAAQPEPTSDDKQHAVSNVLSAKPDAVMIPARQATLRINHPKMKGETFEISGVVPKAQDDEFDLGSMRLLKPGEYGRKWRTPRETENRVRESQVRLTPLASVPSWAQQQVYDYVQSGDLRVFSSQEDAQEAMESESVLEQQTGALLDYDTAEIGNRIVRAENMGLNSDFSPIIVEPRGEFTRPEQEAAWNVLNATIQGETPLPSEEDSVNLDPRAITTAEALHVRNRIERCLRNPMVFTGKKSQVFEQKVFFNTLLECEFAGFTPKRPGSSNKNGGFRPDIFRIIRELAAESGFEVIGDYVTPKADRELKHDLMPSVPIRG